MGNFRNRLIQAMNDKEINATELSKRSGLSKANISQYVNGVYEPKPDKLYLISEALGVSTAWLMGYDVEANESLEQLTKEVEICDLFRKCFGKEAYHLVQMYLSLNQDGKEEAFKRIMELTQLEQYSIKRDSKLTG